MYPEAIVAILTHPLAMLLALAIAATSIWSCKSLLARGVARPTAKRLASSYAAAVIAAACIGAAVDANAPDSSHAGVVFLAYSAVVLIGLFIVPGAAFLASRRRDTIPALASFSLLLSLGITVVFAITRMGQWPLSAWAQQFAATAGFVSVIVIVFAVVARLPWSAGSTR
jgi:hypothetical protein